MKWGRERSFGKKAARHSNSPADVAQLQMQGRSRKLGLAYVTGDG